MYRPVESVVVLPVPELLATRLHITNRLHMHIAAWNL